MKEIERIKELITILIEACNAYYVNDNPIMTDKQYDQLYEELSKLESKTSYIQSNSPTQKVQGKIVDFLQKVKHSESMLSAEKSKDINDVIKFMGNQECILSWKLDGCFSGNMKVYMANGTKKKIKDIKIGDKVLSFNENTKEIDHNKVLNIYNNGRKPIEQWRRLGIYNCKTNNRDSVHVTNNHKFLTIDGWKEVKNVVEGDKIYTYDYILSPSQQSVLIGTCLGDGCAIKRYKDVNGVEFRYSKVNKHPYNILLQKYNSLFVDKLGKPRKSISGYNSEIDTIFINTLKNIPKEMDNKDNILRTGYTFTEEILSLITPLALAIYYMDDGSKAACQDDGSKAACQDDGYDRTKNIKVRAGFSTYRHKIEDVKRLSDFLINKYNINNTIRIERELKTEGSGAVIDILTDGTEIFFDLIAPYIPKEIRPYKLGLKDKWQNAEEIKWWEDIGKMGLTENEVKENKQLVILKGESGLAKHLTAYDIEIEKDHTYIIEGFAVHNCTIVLRYNNGKLEKCLTRGGGEEGEDVTHTVKTFANVPLKIDYSGYLEIRGEGLVTFENFEKVNNDLIINGEKTYSNPRNLAAGSVRQLDARITKKRNLIFIAFGIVKCDKDFEFKNDQFHFLESLGIDVVFYQIVDRSIIVESVNLFNKNIKKLSYLTDGLIIEFNNIEYGKSQGVTGHHSKALYALKWNDDSSETIFRGVKLNTTRTGMVSITGFFDEVDIDGVNVSKASLHNYDIFKYLELGIGDTVTVYRANAVIPQIEENLTRSGTYKIDMKCPSCGSEIVIKTPKEAKFLFCENENCPSKIVNKFVHFCSKDAMDVEGLSEATIEKFIDKGFIKDFHDIYKLEQYKKEIVIMDGFGVKSYNNLIAAIEKSKTIELYRLIYALGVNQIGLGGAKRLSKHFNNDINKFFGAIDNHYDLTQIEDFGDITAQAVNNYFSNAENLNQVNILLDYISINNPIQTNTSNKLEGKIFVITGDVNHFTNRKELQSKIEELGGKCSSSVSARTSYLINNDNTSSSSKNKAAKALNVPIITEEEFIEMIK